MSRSFDIGCTVRVVHTAEHLSAEVELDGDVDLHPGDRVQVHGEEIATPFGETRVLRREATVTRASWLHRFWTRVAGDLECLHLLDVSFSDRRTL